MAKRHTKVPRKNPPQNLVVIELTEGERRVPDRPHLYVLRTQRTPEAVLNTVKEGNGPKWIVGTAKKLRSDLIPKYRTTRKLKVAELRVRRLKVDLAQRGFAINGDAKTWRVYVLDVDADITPSIRNRGRKNHVVYVGQTSKKIETRLREHRGEAFGNSGKYLGSRRTKGRNPRINKSLTPKKKCFTQLDAEKFEVEYSHKLEKAGYRVLGDGLTDPKKKTRNLSK